MENNNQNQVPDKKEVIALQILSLQADLGVGRDNLSILKKMSMQWLQDCKAQLTEAENNLYRQGK